MVHFRNVQIFCAVAEYRNFSRAGIALEMSQPAVSQAISGLEEELGVTLIDRSRRPFQLTDAGERFLRGSRGILAAFERLVDEVRARGSAAANQISIGTIVSVGLTYLPEAMRVFAINHPDVRVNTSYGPSEQVIERVTGGEVDFGLVSFSRSTREIESVAWLDEPMRIICSHDHELADRREVSAANLSGVEMIGFARSLRLRQEIDQVLMDAGITVNVPMEFDNTDSMIRAIQATGGIGILPEAAVHRETAGGSLRVISCPDFRMTRPLAIIFRRGTHWSEPAGEFASLLLGRTIRPHTRKKRIAVNC